MIGLMPEFGIEVPEELSRVALPGPPKVEDHLAQGLDGVGKFRDNVEGVKWLHGSEESLPIRPRRVE